MVRGSAVAKRVTWAIPGDIATLTGGYVYDRRIIAELRRLGWAVDVVGLGDGFPTPSAVQKASAEALLLATPARHPIVFDGLAFGALPEIAARLHEARPVLALVCPPLALETGLSAAQSERLAISERAALASTRSVVATSRWTADLLVERFGVPSGRLVVVEPGTDRRPPSAGSDSGPL